MHVYAALASANAMCKTDWVYSLRCGVLEIKNGHRTGKKGGRDCHCYDLTNKEKTTGVCIAANKCLGKFDANGEPLQLPHACNIYIYNNVVVNCQPLPTGSPSTVALEKDDLKLTLNADDPRAQELNRIVDAVATEHPQLLSGAQKSATADDVLKALYPEQSLVPSHLNQPDFGIFLSQSDAGRALAQLAALSLEGVPGDQALWAFNQNQRALNAGEIELANLSRSAMQLQPTNLDLSKGSSDPVRLSDNVEDRRNSWSSWFVGNSFNQSPDSPNDTLSAWQKFVLGAMSIYEYLRTYF
jgi:hypothetical protein